MSFGTSFGDIVKVVEMARDLRKRFVDAPEQYRAVSSQIKNLSFLLEEVDDVLPHRQLSSQQEKQLKDARNECETILQEIQAKLDDYLDLERPAPGTKKKWHHVAWKRLRWSQKEVTEYCERLRLSMECLSLFLQNVTSDKVFEISQRVQKIDLREESREEREKRQKILERFSVFDYRSQHTTHSKGRCDGTGNWFLESPQFTKFTEGGGETLVCHGIPGAGKTVIASIAISHLQTLTQGDPSIGLAYFYFSYDSRNIQTIEFVFGSLARQLLEQKTHVPCSDDPWSTCQKLAPNSSLEDIMKALQTTMDTFSKTFVVLDALDEYHNAESHRALLCFDQLKTLQAEAGFNLLVTTRPNAEIISRLEDCNQIKIQAHDRDILQYINSRMPELTKIKNKPSLQDEVRDTVKAAVDGMFLLARLHMDALRDPVTLGSFKKCLTSLPHGAQGLNSLYDQAMSRIMAQSEERRELARKVLYWIIYATRGLSTAELIDALAVEPDTSELDEDMRPDVNEIDSLCAGLVTIDESAKVVRLVHKTTQDYFLSKNHFPDAHSEILKVCLTAMSYTGVAERHDGIYVDSYYNRYKFGKETSVERYALARWYRHILPQDTPSEELLTFLLDPPAILSICMRLLLLSRYGGEHDDYKEFGNPKQYCRVLGVHMAAYLGFPWLLKHLVESGQAFDSLDGHSRTPLYYASMAGSLETVKFILSLEDEKRKSNLVETSVVANDPWSAKTDERGRYEKERHQLLQNIGLNERYDLHHFESLCVAANEKHYDIVEELINLDGTAEIAKRCMSSFNPPHRQKGSGPSRSPRSFLPGDPLQNADIKEDIKAFNLILEHWGSWILDAYPTARYRILLNTENEEIVKILIARYLEDEREDKTESGPDLVGKAAEMGLLDSVRRLHAKVPPSPEFFKSSGYFSIYNVLERTALNGHLEVLDLLLLSYPIDPFIRTNYGSGLPWIEHLVYEGPVTLVGRVMAAYESCRDERLLQKLLLEVSWAGQVEIGRKEKLFHLLISKYGVDPNSRDKAGNALLHQTRSGADILIRKYGADPHLRDQKGYTALIYCVLNDVRENESFIQCLRHGLDINAKDDRGMTALSHAAYRYSQDMFTFNDIQRYFQPVGEDMLRWLIDLPGIDTSSTDHDGHTALWWAIKGVETVKGYSQCQADAVYCLIHRGKAEVDSDALLLLQEQLKNTTDNNHSQYLRIQRFISGELKPGHMEMLAQRHDYARYVILACEPRVLGQ